VKRSKAVPLFVLGSVAVLPGCNAGHPVDLQQNRYQTLEDCEHDWGDPGQCSPAPGSGAAGGGSGGAIGGGGRGTAYIGPRYYWDPDTRRPVTIAPNGESRPAPNAHLAAGRSSLGETLHLGSISRGGFGSIGFRFSAAG
jgi:uncharacterized protein YgiB involved in biofilm formation